MKKIVLFGMLLLSLPTRGITKVVGEDFPPLVRDSKQFLFYNNLRIVLPDFPIKNYENEASKDLIFKVPTSSLERFNIKSGTIIQSVDFKTGKKNPNFIVKDYVFARWPREDNSEEPFNQLHLILSYDDKVLDEVRKKYTPIEYATGIAYLGLNRKLYAEKETLQPVVEIKEVDFKREGWNPKTNDTKIYSTKIFNNVLFIRKSSEELSVYESILKTPSEYFGLSGSGRVLTFDRKNMRILNWGENEKLLILSEPSLGGCSYIYILEKKSATYAPLPCSNQK